MKKLLSLLLVLVAAASLCPMLSSCGKASSGITIAVPNDTTNEARALLLLQQLGYIKLKEGVGITATILDIESKKLDLTFNEVEAAQLPNVLPDVDFAVINSNYAISAKLNPAKDALALEGAFSPYGNIIAVKEGQQETPAIKALMAALRSTKVADFIAQKYNGAVVSTVDKPGDGYDTTIDYAALQGKKITVAASPTPHAEILAVAKDILAAKGIVLDIQEYTDYVVPNNIVEDGTVMANYFQHFPYLDDFNAKNGTHLVSAGAIHVEPLGIYGGRKKSLDEIK